MNLMNRSSDTHQTIFSTALVSNDHTPVHKVHSIADFSVDKKVVIGSEKQKGGKVRYILDQERLRKWFGEYHLSFSYKKARIFGSERKIRYLLFCFLKDFPHFFADDGELLSVPTVFQ